MLRLRALSLVLALVASTSAFAQDRFALVIGNGAYNGAAGLKNPANDAAAVSSSLEKLNFKVTKKTDIDLPAMEDAVAAFRKSLTKNSVALFFYAGHGLQVKGENYLLPLDADLKEESQVKRKCFPVDEVLGELEESGSALKIVILDCCRDNPLTRGWTRSTNQGLATISRVPDGTIIAFSTAPGKTALDSAGNKTRNSPYTAHLVSALAQRPAEGLELTRALKDASRAVKTHTGQVPWMNQDATIDDYYLWRDAKTSLGAVPRPVLPLPTPPIEETRSLPRDLKKTGHPHDSKFTTLQNSIGMRFVEIPAGEFLMGSPENDPEASASEKPQIRSKIPRPFYLGMHEVTLGQFIEFYHGAKYKTDAETNGKGGWGSPDGRYAFKQDRQFVAWSTGFPQTKNHPVVNVSYYDATAFCKWLSDKEGVKYRLPTEAEWEYACRAGTKTTWASGANPETLSSLGNIMDATFERKFPSTEETVARRIEGDDGYVWSAPVGSFQPNAFGLYDMHGNAWEMTADWYEESERDGKTTSLTRADADRVHTVLRGGGWNGSPRGARSANRFWIKPGFLLYDTGFRVVLEVE